MNTLLRYFICRLYCFIAVFLTAASLHLYAADMSVSVESRDWLCVQFIGDISEAEWPVTSNYEISSATDPAYTISRSPLRIGRERRLLSFPYYPNHSLAHTNGYWSYLQLPMSLQNGNTYTVRVLNVNGAPSVATLYYDDRYVTNRNIKISQCGYAPTAPVKYAYIGGYLGDAGALPLAFAATAYVYNAETDALVSTVPFALRADENKTYSHPTYSEKEMSGESVYECNFSSLSQSGMYYLYVPGVGRSYSFAVSNTIYRQLYEDIAHAVYLQRCGCAITAENSEWFQHGMCHTQAMEITTSTNIDTFIAGGSGTGVRRTVHGGWHDAGDYDRRAYHLDPVRRLLDTYEILGKKAQDGDAPVPEKNNGIPDILDEAWWGLKVWCDLQADDGGVFGGTERMAEGGMDEPVDDPLLDYYLFSRNCVNNEGEVVPVSAWFAAAGAQFSRCILPYDDSRAQMVFSRAKKAFQYAQNHADATQSDAMADAAAEFLCTTGLDEYRMLYETSGVYRSFSLAMNTQVTIDSGVRSACRNYWMSQASDTVDALRNDNSYRCARPPYRAIRFGGGSGGHDAAHDLCKGHALAGSTAFLDSVFHDAYFVMGCNPLGYCWITGNGLQSPQQFLHRLWIIDGRGEVPPGYHIYGPFAKSSESESYGMHYETFWNALYPEGLNYPRMRMYTPSEWMAGMNEFTVAETLIPGYCTFAYLSFYERNTTNAMPLFPPGILVTAPDDYAHISDATVDVYFRVEGVHSVTGVYVNGNAVSGAPFHSYTYALQEGTNSLRITAYDENGMASTSDWHIVCTVPEPSSVFLLSIVLLILGKYMR